MTVELVDIMGTDLSVVNAARVSYANTKDTFDISDEKLIKYLAEHEHWSPFAHASLQFRIKAPIFVARQLVEAPSRVGMELRFQDATWTMHLSCTNQTHGGADHRIQNRVQMEK